MTNQEKWIDVSRLYEIAREKSVGVRVSTNALMRGEPCIFLASRGVEIGVFHSEEEAIRFICPLGVLDDAGN